MSLAVPLETRAAHDRDGEDLYTVLELLEGPDLCELLAQSGPLPWRQVIGTYSP